MNPGIKKLAGIAAKSERRIIGLMSGTSLDGLDVAVCKVKNAGLKTEVALEKFETVLYTDSFKKQLHDICFTENVSLQKLTLLNRKTGLHYAEIITGLLAKWDIDKSEIDLIASHGQTVYHSPAHTNDDGNLNATLQLGDGDTIAMDTGIITVSDFRQKHIAAGGEGAPLAVYGDIILFSEKDCDVILLNIGGIASFTFLPAKGEIICSDIGPGNTLMNQWVKEYFPGKDMDENGGRALQGKINYPFLESLKMHSFFTTPFPKTTGPELFNAAFIRAALAGSVADLSHEDIVATLNKFSADIICAAINSMDKKDSCKIYISGGGIHNPVLMKHLKEGLGNVSLHSTFEKNIDPDAKEAVLFALLANECVAGDPITFSKYGNYIPAVSMGKISFPH